MVPIFLLFSLISTFSSFCFASHGSGLTVDLIHRESSPLSPFYNPSNTRFGRLSNAFRRSFSRSSKFSSQPNTIQSQLTSIPGEYLMKLSVGTPPFDVLAIADTGSDLTWVQCKPCTECYKQISPLFNPHNSSTYRTLACDSNPCDALISTICTQDVCGYKYTYGDKSFTNGDLAVETWTFSSSSGRPVPIPKVVFGCGHNNGGTFNGTSSGIIGLGGGPLSIINQLKESINGRFSYCLVPIDEGSNATSKINFGPNAIVSGSGVVSTPLVQKAPVTYYYLTLERISVGNHSLGFKTTGDDKAAEEGNIIIDSGTTLTLLPDQIYEDLESKLKEAVVGQPTRDPNGLFSLCYSNEGQLSVPTITFHFAGADVALSPSSTFVEIAEGVACLAMIPTSDVAIFGNLSQMNFLVGYDLVKKEVSLKPTDCSKH